MGGRPRRARARPRARGVLALTCGPARAGPPRDGGGRRAVHARRRVLHRRARAGDALACDRGGARPAIRRRGDANGPAPRARRPTRRRGAGGRVRLPRVPVVHPIGDVVDPAEHGAHRRVGVQGSRARRRRERGKGTCASGARRTSISSERPQEILDEAAAVADALGSLELRSFALGARTQSAFDQRRFQEAAAWSEERLALLPGIDDPDHLCEAYESGSPAAAAVCHFDEARRLGGAPCGPLAAALGASSRPLRLARARARRCAGRLVGAGGRDGSCSDRHRGESGHALRAESPRPAPLRPRTSLPRRRESRVRARGGRAASRGRGIRDLPQRRAAPDCPRTWRPPRGGVARRSSSGARARLGTGDLLGSTRRLHRARPARPDRARGSGARAAGDDRGAVRPARARCARDE